MFATALFVGCENNPEDLGSTTPTPPVMNGNYIQFDVEIGTRGEVISDLPSKIGIYGYQYQIGNNWNTYRVTAKPNVFNSAPQVATNNNGFYSYEPQKPWTGNKYTFFAYAPVDNNNLSVSDETVQNSPYVDYKVDSEDHTKHVDILTAAHYVATASSNTINFTMQHRTALVEVGVLNAYEYSYDVNGSTNTEQIEIEITDLTVNFENLHYSGAKIYLDDVNMPMTKTVATDKTASYHIVNGTSATFGYNTTSDIQHLPSNMNAAMFFIPQTQTDLKVKVEGTFKKKRPNGQYVKENDTEVFTIDKEVAFNAPLMVGCRHDVVLSFTSAAVSINVVTSAAWDMIDKDGDGNDDKIEHEFE